MSERVNPSIDELLESQNSHIDRSRRKQHSLVQSLTDEHTVGYACITHRFVVEPEP